MCYRTNLKAFSECTNCSIRQVVGAIDGKHIDIPAPTTDSKIDYYRRKQKYKIKTQAVVGVNLVFLDVDMAITSPRFIHDARRLWSIAFFRKCEGRDTISKPEKVIDGLKSCPMLLGDGAFLPTTWLVK